MGEFYENSILWFMTDTSLEHSTGLGRPLFTSVAPREPASTSQVAQVSSFLLLGATCCVRDSVPKILLINT